MNNPNLTKARALLSPTTMTHVQREPYTAQGWKILERWTANSPAALLALERRGLVVFLNRMLDQQKAESAALRAALDQHSHLAPHEVFELAGIDTELARTVGDPFGSYSDWRTSAPLAQCPRCVDTHLYSRDCPDGIEIECAGVCGYREVVTAATWETLRKPLPTGRLASPL